MNEECDIVYYNPESGVKFNKQQVKVPIWFKKRCQSQICLLLQQSYRGASNRCRNKTWCKNGQGYYRNHRGGYEKQPVYKE